MSYAFTIEAEHVGQAVVKVGGRNYWASSFIGRILPGDVGKRVYSVPCADRRLDLQVLQVESDQQRDARLGRR